MSTTPNPTKTDESTAAPPLRLSDEWRDSRSARRSDPDTGEPLTVTQIDATRFNVKLGSGDAHTTTVYTRRHKFHARCTCRARCQDCAHVLALLRRDGHGLSFADVAIDPRGNE
jgi:hypothetical protein